MAVTGQDANVQIKTTLVSLIICSAIGGVGVAFSSLSWLAATCFAAAALLVNGALATWEDSRPSGFYTRMDLVLGHLLGRFGVSSRRRLQPSSQGR